MEPTPYIARAPEVPTGHWLTRGLAAVLFEHRLPYAASKRLDQLLNRIGLRFKIVTVNGYRIKVRRLTQDELFIQNILVHYDYTRPGYEIGEEDTVIDIGGNIGVFALMAARKACRGKVFTFEPIAENFRLLTHNLKLNRAANATARKAAVLDRNGQVKIFLNPINTGGHSISKDASAHQRYEEVDAVTLEQVFQENKIQRCHFLKLDCEGSEYPILYNLPRGLFALIDKIVMEYHAQPPADKRKTAKELVQFLQGAGYHIDEFIDHIGFGSGFILARRLNG